jgi:uncharacterized phage-like protein YoqJ
MIEIQGQDRFSNSTSEGVNTRKNKAQFALVQKQMQDCLNQLGINLVVLWIPNESKSIHGEIKGNVIFLYNSEKAEAWNTFTHEITEYKLQAVTRPYRILVNNLIEAVEKSIYAEKEQFIEFLPKMIEVIKQRQMEKGKT